MSERENKVTAFCNALGRYKKRKGTGGGGKVGKTFWAPEPSENVWFSLGFLRKIKDLGCCAVIHGIQYAWIGFVAFEQILDNFGSFWIEILWHDCFQAGVRT